MPELLPMINKRTSKIMLNLLLNAADGLAALALLLGGWNATNVSAVTGYTTMATGLLLIYLSAGLWFEKRWKFLVRISVYLAAGTILLVSFSLVSLHEHLTKLGPVPLVLFLILANVMLSLVRLRLAGPAAK